MSGTNAFSRRVECVCKIQVAANHQHLACSSFLDGLVQALHLPLPAEPLGWGSCRAYRSERRYRRSVTMADSNVYSAAVRLPGDIARFRVDPTITMEPCASGQPQQRKNCPVQLCGCWRRSRGAAEPTIAMTTTRQSCSVACSGPKSRLSHAR